MSKVLIILLKGISKLPFGLLYAIGDFFLFPVLFYIVKYRRKVVQENLLNSFPNKSSAELRSIEKKYYRNLADIIIETFKIGSISEQEIEERCTFENWELAEELTSKGKNIVSVLGHMGNWEIAAVRYPLYVSHECLYVYKPIKDKDLDNYIRGTRGQTGGNLIPMKETFDAIKMANESNKNWNLVLIADQAPRPRKSYWMNFLHQPTPVFFGPERIARSENAALVYISGHRVSKGRYVYRMDLVTDDCSKLGHGELTDIHVKMLEKDIEKYPADWTWSHRRWKHKMPSDLPAESLSVAHPPIAK